MSGMNNMGFGLSRLQIIGNGISYVGERFNNSIKSKTFHCSIIFLAGFVVGYIIGMQQKFSITLHGVINFKKNLLNLISPVFTFTPEPHFLSDIATFEAVIIGLAVPLSLEMVSRISERYQSEVISKQFLKEREVKLLPILLMLNIFLAIGLRFFVTGEQSSIIWKILAWITLVSFLVIGIIFVKFIKKLENYITNPEFILDGLYDKAEKSLE